MKFYKIEGVIKDNTEEENEGGKYNKALQIRLKTQEYNKTHGDGFVCIERMRGSNLTLGCISVNNSPVQERVKDYLKFLEIDTDIICAEPVTMKTFFSLVSSAVLLSYLSDQNNG